MSIGRFARRVPLLAGLTAAMISWSSSTIAEIVSVGGSVVLREPPASILLDQWESNSEIRGWFEREVTLASDLILGHVNPGLVNDESQLVNGTVLTGTSVQSYMVREDPVNDGPALLTGFVIFDTPIFGVLIGSQLGPTDGLLGRPGVAYNANSFRGLELDAATEETDSFNISADRLRIDFTMEVGEWTDDIRIVTAVPEPTGVGLIALGGMCAIARRRR